MAFTTITYEVSHRIAAITLNRPEARNAFTLTMADELNAALLAADGDDSVRVVILRAAGKHFCVGMDMSDGDPTVGDSDDPYWDEPATRVARPLTNLNKPVIAAIQGAAVGVGLSMTLPADFRLASDDARFGFVFARRGLFPEGGSLWFLPHLVGLAKAKDWMISGRVFDAREALAAGLITGVHPPEELWPAADALAQDICANIAPVSAAVIRRGLVAMAARGDPETAFSIDKQTISYGFGTEDMAEGVASFLEKRAAEFTGVARAVVARFPWLVFSRE
jgi:enoyl-CoA hydratase/carnithine racemase